MNRDEAKRLILEQEPSFLKDCKAKAKGRKTYVCPKCGNGGHDSGTGIVFDPTSTKPNAYTCFAHGERDTMDIIELWKADKGITDFNEALKGLCNYYGIELDEPQEKRNSLPYRHNSTSANQPTPTTQKIDIRQYPQEQPKTDYSKFIQACNDCLHSDLQAQNFLQSRGISLETADKFQIGYCQNWTHPTGKTPQKNVIILPSGEGYISRDINPQCMKQYRYMNVEPVGLFNSDFCKSDEPLFVVEGMFDALSVIELGFEATALNSISNKTLFLQELQKQKPNRPIILALDNDEAGQKAQKELLQNVPDYVAMADVEYLFDNHKDANESLIADREAFRKRLEFVSSSAVSEFEEWKKERQDEYDQSTLYSYIPQFLENIRQSIYRPPLSTGFQNLDALLDGGLYEGLYIIGAMSSAGKTSLCLQIADQIAERGHDVIFFSLEMSRAELLSKSISRLTALLSVDQCGDVRYGKHNRDIIQYSRWQRYNETEKKIIMDAVAIYQERPSHNFRVIESGFDDIGTDFIRATVSDHYRITGRKPLVIVDYLQILAPVDIRATDKQNTDQNVKALKRISKEFNIPLMAISSFNRDNYDKPVSMQSFKESGAIEYCTDVLFGLQYKGQDEKDFDRKKAETKNPLEIELKILKNRNGKKGVKAYFRYYPKYNLFLNN